MPIATSVINTAIARSIENREGVATCKACIHQVNTRREKTCKITRLSSLGKGCSAPISNQWGPWGDTRGYCENN
eukprot:558161-Prorocentrum_minimum.AAC.2